MPHGNAGKVNRCSFFFPWQLCSVDYIILFWTVLFVFPKSGNVINGSWKSRSIFSKNSGTNQTYHNLQSNTNGRYVVTNNKSLAVTFNLCQPEPTLCKVVTKLWEGKKYPEEQKVSQVTTVALQDVDGLLPAIIWQEKFRGKISSTNVEYISGVCLSSFLA